MFATIKNLIPEPRQVDQPRHYVGRHRGSEALEPATVDGTPVDGTAALDHPAPAADEADHAVTVSADVPERTA